MGTAVPREGREEPYGSVLKGSPDDPDEIRARIAGNFEAHISRAEEALFQAGRWAHINTNLNDDQRAVVANAHSLIAQLSEPREGPSASIVSARS
jgi:hypothetical protein